MTGALCLVGFSTAVLVPAAAYWLVSSLAINGEVDL